ncbi:MULTISPECIES: translocation protein TolB [Bacillus]|uniref:translocation protein TolB n=1 Tax=Bacillus TaxID=1386 RepID=UPI000C75ABB2|nr:MULTISPECIES: translocation protein TolB [Bacillus]PLR83394.1 translocation protein TolB [Bacillus sp. V33-4]RSK51754.1 translocation protein TolB [Bacillus canaveralius]
MKTFILSLTVFAWIIHPLSFVRAESTNELKAAFIRDNDLWIKITEQETKITNGEFVRYPKWSYDGSYVAYLKDQKQNEPLYEGSLWIYDLKLNQHYKIDSNVSNNFQWAPNKNTLAYQTATSLHIADAAKIDKIHQIASRIENFSWLPDGSGLLTSSKANKNIFSDIRLTRILFNKKINQPESHDFYTVKVGQDDYFISTSEFKWSFDGAWIAFQLVPTASMSADSNTLCIISRDGQHFQKIGEMLSDEGWFQWAPNHNTLAYIEGVGRTATLNKHLNVTAIDKKKTINYTPGKFADRDFTWVNGDLLIATRSYESDLVDIEQRPMPSLYRVNIDTDEQKKVTTPLEKEGDFRPQYNRDSDQLVWIRTNRKRGDVLTSNRDGLNQIKWIENIKLGSWYYEKWNWDEVFCLYKINDFKEN